MVFRLVSHSDDVRKSALKNPKILLLLLTPLFTYSLPFNWIYSPACSGVIVLNSSLIEEAEEVVVGDPIVLLLLRQYQLIFT